MGRIGVQPGTRAAGCAAVVPRCGGHVYADFGSTEAVSISEGPAALVYCYLNQDPNGRRKDALLPLAIERWRAAGVAVRVSFYDRCGD